MTHARHLAASGAVVALLVTAAACGSEDSAATTRQRPEQPRRRRPTPGTRRDLRGHGFEAPAESSAAAPAEGAGAVAIANFAFDPADVEVAAGTTVTWTNDDGTPHRVKANDDSFDSEDMGQGDTFEHTFDAAGTFRLHLRHPPVHEGHDHRHRVTSRGSGG